MSTLEAGKIFERYRIIQQLGSGISGESYEAEDIILLRKVTLKLIHPWTVLSDAARRQFFREMQGISTLNHPYLASMLDYGEINGKLYVARRYVSSGSLLGNDGRLWFRPPLSISDAIYYGHQLAQALEYIHKQGYLHGSLSFANILVSRGPNPDNYPGYAPFILADVGLANFVRRFGEPELKFLPITAAPEQLGQRVTQASDQFALAVLIYFWLTGRPPYLGTPEEIEELKLTETIAPLLSLNPKATIEQDVVLRRALTVYPEDRYPSVLAFADALLATLPPQSQSDTEIASTTQLAVITQTEPYEALEEVKTAPAAEPELIQPSEPAPITEPEIVPQAEVAASTESEPESDLLLQPYPELSPETAPVSEIESVASEPQPAHLAEPLSSIEPEEVSEPSSPPIVEPASPVSSLEIQPVSEPEPESESASPVSSFEIQPDAEAEPESEPIVAETEVDVEYETKPTIANTEADIEQETEVDIEQEAQSTVAESEPGIEYVAESAEDTPQLQQMTDSTPQPLPDIPEPTPDPVPQPVPDLPQPLPTPDIPEPTPDPVPQPTPDPIPQPAPDVPPQVPDPVPQIVPDVPQPLPEPDTPQSTPEAGEQSEPLAEEELSISQEIVSAAQEQEPPVSIQDQELPPQLEEPETLPLTRLVIISPYAEEAYEVLVEHDETTIGRAGSSDVLLDHDNSTSRHHALLKREGDHYVLYDRRSANGVFVNGQMLMGEVGYVLEDGDHISMGNYELIFRCKRSEVADEPGESASESEVITSWSFF